MPKSRTNLTVEQIPVTYVGQDYKTLSPPNTLEMSVFYTKGGANYFSGTQDARGYYLSATPVTIDKADGTKSFLLFAGTKAFLEGAKAFNAKRLEAIGAGIKAHERYETLKAHVLAKGQLTVDAPAVVAS